MSILSTIRGLFTPRRDVKARLDLTTWTSENKRHWRDADALSARAAYPKFERKIARERSRLEASNNSWYSGMLRTAANHIVGTGPRLQVLTADPALNARIESAWRKWASATLFTEKLRIAVETYWRDGECFGMRAQRPSLGAIPLDVRLYEGDQVSMPYQHFLDPSIDDGKRVDNLGNAIEFWIFDNHPGDIGIGHTNYLAGEWYSATDVWHLFRADRPGQLRGIPRCSPAIDWLAHMRRFSKATLSAAESAALWGVFIKTTSSQVEPANTPGDFLDVEFQRNVMNFLPEGWEPTQLNPEHPATTNEMFQRTELMYFCRCANMPYSLACGTSKDANFSAAKMDIKNLWEPEVQSEQDKLNHVVMAPTFRWFLEECVFAAGILDGAPPIGDIEYRFDWPPLPQSDEGDVAAAALARMSSGQSTLRKEYMRQGEDFDAAMISGAADYGVTVPDFKKAIFAKLFATGGTPGGAAPAAATPAPGAAAADVTASSAGAFVGTKLRDFSNNQKQTTAILTAFREGTSEVLTRQSLTRLGWSDEAAQELIDDARQGQIDTADTAVQVVTP